MNYVYDHGMLSDIHKSKENKDKLDAMFMMVESCVVFL